MGIPHLDNKNKVIFLSWQLNKDFEDNFLSIIKDKIGATNFLHNTANKEEFEGNTEHSTAAYTLVREDASTGLTYKLPLEASYARSLLIFFLCRSEVLRSKFYN